MGSLTIKNFLTRLNLPKNCCFPSVEDTIVDALWRLMEYDNDLTLYLPETEESERDCLQQVAFENGFESAKYYLTQQILTKYRNNNGTIITAFEDFAEYMLNYYSNYYKTYEMSFCKDADGDIEFVSIVFIVED